MHLSSYICHLSYLSSIYLLSLPALSLDLIQELLPSKPILYPDIQSTVWANFICRSLEDAVFLVHPWPRNPVS